MKHYQRAVVGSISTVVLPFYQDQYTLPQVLAHRGENWILLHNVCRSLWNSITVLVNTISPTCQRSRGLSRGQAEDVREVEVSLAAVYGLALKPLYFAASALLDSLLACGVCMGENKVRDCSPLRVISPSFLPCTLQPPSVLDLTFVKRLTFLAIHVLYTHQHWEKTIAVATSFDNVTKYVYTCSTLL